MTYHGIIAANDRFDAGSPASLTFAGAVVVTSASSLAGALPHQECYSTRMVASLEVLLRLSHATVVMTSQKPVINTVVNGGARIERATLRRYQVITGTEPQLAGNIADEATDNKVT